MKKQNMATSCTKPIWKVTFKERDGPVTTENFLAYRLEEVLSHYTEYAINKIIEIKKTDQEETYVYE